VTAKPPGFGARKRLRQELPDLAERVRAALVAACAERMLPILDGHFAEPAFADAVAAIWAYALGGPVERDRHRRLVDAMERRVEQLYEAGEDGSMLYAVNAVNFGLQSILTTSELARRSLVDAQGAADLDAGDIGERYIQEEADWQMAALDIALRTAVPTRDMFAELPTDSQWRRTLSP
jgi:hypothetical protein